MKASLAVMVEWFGVHMIVMLGFGLAGAVLGGVYAIRSGRGFFEVLLAIAGGFIFGILVGLVVWFVFG